MFQPPLVQQAAGPGMEQAGPWVAGNPGPQAAGCGSSCSSCFPLLPDHHPAHHFHLRSLVKWIGTGFSVCLLREHQAGLASNPSSALAEQFLHYEMRIVTTTVPGL